MGDGRVSMRVLRVADVPDNRSGGMSRLMHGTADEMVAAGHEVDFLFQEQLDMRGPSRLRRFAVPIRIVQLVRRLIQSGRRYDVVEIHEPSAAAYAAARRVDRSLPPLVVISHGIEYRSHRNLLSYSAQKRLPVSLKQRYGYRLTTLWQSNYSLRNADHVLVLNTEDQDYLASAYQVPKERVTVIHSAAPASFLACGGPSPGSGVLFLATWLGRKGVPDAVRVLTRVLRECTGTRVTIAGCGCPAEVVRADFPEDCREAINVVPDIRGDAALLAEYRRHCVYLLPSVFEGQPLTMMEAAAAGLALVCTATCGMKDFIQHEKNGLLAAVGDADSLSNAVIRLLHDSALAHRLGAQVQQDVRAYTWRRSAGLLLAGYSAAAEAGASKGRVWRV